MLDRCLPNKFAFSLSIMAKVLSGFNKGGAVSLLLDLFFNVFYKEPLVGVSDDKND